MSNPYVIETGPGYLGVSKVSGGSCGFGVGMLPFDREDNRVWAVEEPPGVAIVDDEPSDPIAEYNLSHTPSGPGHSLTVGSRALSRVEVENGDDVRLYERDCGGGVVIVPADPDPFLQDDGIVVQETSENPWEFFYEIRDVTELGPGEEQAQSWEAMIGGERVGMAVLDPYPSPVHVHRVAVVDEHRRKGVATSLLRRIEEEHGPLRCYVRKSNQASLALMASLGYKRSASRWPSLWTFESHPGGDTPR